MRGVDCRYFEGKGSRGLCRRYPPGEKGFVKVGGIVKSWCGEFKRKNSEEMLWFKHYSLLWKCRGDLSKLNRDELKDLGGGKDREKAEDKFRGEFRCSNCGKFDWINRCCKMTGEKGKPLDEGCGKIEPLIMNLL